MAHNGSIVPVPGRDVFVQAWYQGGISVIDFTDSANPVEIAYFDRGPIDVEELILGGFWSSYWYNGLIYGTEIQRGLDVLALLPSEYLSEAEIAAAVMANQGGVFNPQQQFPVTWPAEPAVARSYLDQLERSGGLSAAQLKGLTNAIDRAEKQLDSGTFNTKLATEIQALAASLEVASGKSTQGNRQAALSKTLRGIATRLQ